MTNVDWASCSDHFSIYMNTESLCCTSETKKMLYVENTSVNNHLPPKASWQRYEVAIIIISISQIRKLKHRKVQWWGVKDKSPSGTRAPWKYKCLSVFFVAVSPGSGTVADIQEEISKWLLNEWMSVLEGSL